MLSENVTFAFFGQAGREIIEVKTAKLFYETPCMFTFFFVISDVKSPADNTISYVPHRTLYHQRIQMFESSYPEVSCLHYEELYLQIVCKITRRNFRRQR